MARLHHLERAAIALQTIDTLQSIHREPTGRVEALAQEIVRRELVDLEIATSMRDLDESIEGAETLFFAVFEKTPA